MKMNLKGQVSIRLNLIFLILNQASLSQSHPCHGPLVNHESASLKNHEAPGATDTALVTSSRLILDSATIYTLTSLLATHDVIVISQQMCSISGEFPDISLLSNYSSSCSGSKMLTLDNHQQGNINSIFD